MPIPRSSVVSRNIFKPVCFSGTYIYVCITWFTVFASGFSEGVEHETTIPSSTGGPGPGFDDSDSDNEEENDNKDNTYTEQLVSYRITYLRFARTAALVPERISPDP